MAGDDDDRRATRPREELGAAATLPSPAQRPATDQRLFDDVKRALFDPSRRPIAEEEPGRILAGRYRLIAFLGEGGMGRVWRAHDLVLDEEVAIKFLPRRLAQREGHLERFVREVRIARQVSHGNVCRVHDISSVDEHPFLSMEYIDGEDLGALLRRIGRLGRDKAVELAHELCAGLAALHERGILHRDLKPSNVMIDGRGRARITDFGLAALDSELSADDARDGTPAYQAPEQVEGRAVTVRSDVYALGVLLFEMFAGARWIELDGSAGERAIAAESVLQPIDAGVAAVVRQCLDPDPDARPSSVLEVAASLPGGDPLAAALAAGRLPSPEAVANARTVGGLSPSVAGAVLVATIVTTVVTAGLVARQSLLDAEALPPDVLVHRARQLLEDSGHDVKFASDARFVDIDEAYIAPFVVAYEPGDPSVLSQLHDAATTPLVLTYRGVEQPRWPDGREIAPDDPELEAGDARITLDMHGRPLGMLVIPPEELGTEEPQAADFTPLFDAFELDEGSLTPVAPRTRPEVYADEHVAYDATIAEKPVHIEAAALRGHPVWLHVDRHPDDALAVLAASRVHGGALAGVTAITIVGAFVALLFAGLLRVIRTLRRPEGDRVAARRLGYAVSGVGVLAHVLKAQSFIDVFNRQLLAVALVFGFMMWLVYLMIEPFARQRLPRSLISWNRLMQGRWRDPMVGRDALLGAAAGTLVALSTPMAQLIGGRAVPLFEGETLLGARFAASVVLVTMLEGAIFAMGLYLVLSLTEAIVRRRRVALGVISLVTLLFALVAASQSGWLAAVFVVGFVALFALFVFRFGLLATTVLCAVAPLITNFPIALGGQWWMPIGFIPLLVVLAIALFGYVYTTAPERARPRTSSRATRT